MDSYCIEMIDVPKGLFCFLFLVFQDSLKRQAILSVYKKLYNELKDIAKVDEISTTDYKMTIIATANQSFIDSEKKEKTDKGS